MQWAHTQRRALHQLIEQLANLGYDAGLAEDKQHRTGWVARIEHPRSRILGLDLRQRARLTIWCRPDSNGVWHYQWPFEWPIAPAESHTAALTYVTTLLGPPDAQT